VLGTARSGTTWLANLLISHPDIVGMAAREHQGVHESHLLDHTRYALPGEMTREEFANRYAAEDYFTLAGVSRADLCTTCAPRGDAIAFFRTLMDLVAQKRGARYWLEKTPKHAIYVKTILQRFPDARFAVITRNFPDTMKSQLALYANPRAGWLRRRVEKVFRYESDVRALRLLTRRAPAQVVSVTYEALADDAARETSRILRFLDLREWPLVSEFPPASSFGPGRAPPRAVALPERVALGLGRLLCRAVPLRAMLWIRERHDRRKACQFPKYSLLTGS
jgi:hypothetical protein